MCSFFLSFSHLQKLVDFPTDDVYFFLIERIDAIAFTIQSLKLRGWYLHCSELGKVSIRKKEANKDLRTWFRRIERAIQYQKRSMVFDRNDSGIEFDFFEETLDVKVPGKDDRGNAVEEKSEEAQNQNVETPDVGNSEAPGDDNCNDADSGKPQRDAAEVTPKDQEEDHYGEL